MKPWPDGMAGRFALLLVAALAAATAAAVLVLFFERARIDRAALVEREAERIESLVPAIEAAAPQRRNQVARAASTRSSRVSVDPRPIVEQQSSAPRSAALRRDLSDELDGREVRAAIMLRPNRDGHGPRETVAISIRLAMPDTAPPQWLNVLSRGEEIRSYGSEEEVFILVLGLVLVLVLGVGLLFVRRLTRPLSDFASAARAAGRGDRTARVPETGPREMRDAAAAFNDMQARIARFDDERMRIMAAVGHDLRTPITSLRIRAEMLDEGEGAPMIRTLDEMTVMADGLVSYARGSGAGDSEEARTVDLADMLARLCADRGADCAPSPPVPAIVRPVALGRAIGNLVDNALRYGGSAHVSLTSGPDRARITIEDTGPGIPEDRLTAVFDPFVRGDDSRNTDTGGAGLGLSIARNIVMSHGGSVALENRASGGLRAVVALPLAAGG